MNYRLRWYKVSHLSLNVFRITLRKLNVQMYTSTAVIRFKSGTKSITNSKYLQEIVSFHSYVYAD